MYADLQKGAAMHAAGLRKVARVARVAATFDSQFVNISVCGSPCMEGGTTPLQMRQAHDSYAAPKAYVVK